jgi:hypothetical protein
MHHPENGDREVFTDFFLFQPIAEGEFSGDRENIEGSIQPG